MSKKYIAYAGDTLTIEWYHDDSGKSGALHYFQKLPISQKKKLAHLFQLLANIGTIRNEQKFRNEGDKIFAFKPAPDRFLCFFYEGGKVIVTNAFVKKTNKLPKREKEKAIKARQDYIKRCKRGTYYE